jgi:hypothetical protein
LLKINLDFLLRKTGASLNFKTDLVSLNISPGLLRLIQLHLKKPNIRTLFMFNFFYQPPIRKHIPCATIPHENLSSTFNTIHFGMKKIQYKIVS